MLQGRPSDSQPLQQRCARAMKSARSIIDAVLITLPQSTQLKRVLPFLDLSIASPHSRFFEAFLSVELAFGQGPNVLR